MKYKKDLVSIYIPVYNSKYTVMGAINSALIQSYPNVEVIVCDNNSTDGTWELIKEFESKKLYKNLKIFRNKKNIGVARNWLQAQEKVTGEFCHILHADDLISPTYIDRMVHIFKQNKQVGLIHVPLTHFSQNKNIECIETTGYNKPGAYSSKILSYLHCVEAYNVGDFPSNIFRTEVLNETHIIKHNLLIDEGELPPGGIAIFPVLLSFLKYPLKYYHNEINLIFFNKSPINRSSISQQVNHAETTKDTINHKVMNNVLLSYLAKAFVLEEHFSENPEMIKIFNSILIKRAIPRLINIDKHFKDIKLKDFYVKNTNFDYYKENKKFSITDPFSKANFSISI